MADANDQQARILIRAVPGSATSGVVGRYGDAWKVRVRSAPERGRANSELVSLLADLVGVPGAAVAVTVGASGRDKHVVIHGVSQQHVIAKLEEAAQSR